METTSQVKEIEISLSENHLRRVAQCDPSIALIELVWNALDAAATRIDVMIKENELGGVAEVHVKDNGTGIESSAIESAFGSLGHSLKAKQPINNRGHRVHGSLGEGRFKAYSLGNQVKWITKNSTGTVTEINGSREAIRRFKIQPTEDKNRPTGTHFIAINGYGAEMKLPSADKLVDRLSIVFAPKLLAENDIKIFINSSALNPELRIDAQETVDLETFSGTKVKTVVWKPSKSKIHEIVWCDESFNARENEEVDASASCDYSVFVASPEVSRAIEENTFELREATILGQIKEKSIEVAQKFIRKNTKEKISRTVHELKDNGVYPYEGIPKGDLETLERNVFNVCATKVIESIPGIASGTKDRQRLTLHLLRTALETSPSSVQHVFEKILKLPKEDIDELSEILNRVSISGLIKLGKLVVDRRDFLSGLEHILFDRESKKSLLERTQLHKILETETWIFGEEFSLGCSDETLNSVLTHHHNRLGHSEEAVELGGGKNKQLYKIPDLVLSRQYKFGVSDQYKHLIVELKRPSVKIGFDEKMQIEKYASAVSGDPRFDKTKTRWVFVAVSTDVKEDISALFQSSDGRVDPGKNPNVEIYIKPWSSIIQAAKGRMDYLWQRTEAQSSKGDGLSYLKDKYPEILEPLS